LVYLKASRQRIRPGAERNTTSFKSSARKKKKGIIGLEFFFMADDLVKAFFYIKKMIF